MKGKCPKCGKTPGLCVCRKGDLSDTMVKMATGKLKTEVPVNKGKWEAMLQSATGLELTGRVNNGGRN